MNKPTRKKQINMNEPTPTGSPSSSPASENPKSPIPDPKSEPVPDPKSENEAHLARFEAIANAAKLIHTDVRNSAEYVGHYLREGNREAAITAYQRLREKLNQAHQILTEHIQDWPTI
jgi:hypothetical protein